MRIGVVGATGLVGSKLISLIENTILPITELRLIASEKSRGKKVRFKNQILNVLEISDKVFDNLDLVFFMANNEIAKKFVKIAVKNNAVVIDNSSTFRLTEGIPLITPEVNFNIINKDNKIIANPNCSTIQLVIPLNLINKTNKIKRVDVATYQAVSGAGKEAIDEYKNQIKNYFNKRVKPEILPVKGLRKHYEIIDNAIPQIDLFEEHNYTKEEMKVIYESQKILNINFSISCTAVRIPILNGHSESVTVTLKDNVNLEAIINEFKKEENLIILDDINNQIYPLATLSTGNNEVFIGRIRKDIFNNNIIHFWVVADNIYKGAAANALQIAEKCYSERIYGW